MPITKEQIAETYRMAGIYGSGARLNEREKGFLRSLNDYAAADHFRGLSPKQERWYNALAARLESRAAYSKAREERRCASYYSACMGW